MEECDDYFWLVLGKNRGSWVGMKTLDYCRGYIAPTRF